MSDLDFDELDQAVTSLVDDSKASKQQADDKAQPDAVASPANQTKPSDAKKITKSRQRSGPLIDVVHRPDSSLPLRQAAPQVGKKTIMPLEKEDTTKQVDHDKNLQNEDSPPKDNSQDLSELRMASDWPDPLDMPASSEASKNSRLVNKETDTKKSEPSYQPSSTPFLQGTKVDKRPLGQADAHANKKNTSDLNTNDDATRPEFDEELVKIESDETNSGQRKQDLEPIKPADELSDNASQVSDEELFVTAAQEEPSLEVEAESPVVEEAVIDTDEKESESAEVLAVETTELEEPNDQIEQSATDHANDETAKDELDRDKPVEKEKSQPAVSGLLAAHALTSIPDQYKKTALVSDPRSDQPLFNAEHYQQPPAASSHHSTGKTSFVQWVFIVLGLLLLGALLGTTVFVLLSGQSL